MAFVEILLLCSVHIVLAYTPNDAIDLNEVAALTFRRGLMTTARRSAPIPQLICKGGPACDHVVDVVQCRNVGPDDKGEIQWKCEADLDEKLRFGEIQVSCEGYRDKHDQLKLRGSCGLVYSLHFTEKGEESRRQNHRAWYQWFGDNRQRSHNADWSTSAFFDWLPGNPFSDRGHQTGRQSQWRNDRSWLDWFYGNPSSKSSNEQFGRRGQARSRDDSQSWSHWFTSGGPSIFASADQYNQQRRHRQQSHDTGEGSSLWPTLLIGGLLLFLVTACLRDPSRHRADPRSAYQRGPPPPYAAAERPPPYSPSASHEVKDDHTSAQAHSPGGFWLGAALGGLAAALMGWRRTPEPERTSWWDNTWWGTPRPGNTGMDSDDSRASDTAWPQGAPWNRRWGLGQRYGTGNASDLRASDEPSSEYNRMYPDISESLRQGRDSPRQSESDKRSEPTTTRTAKAYGGTSTR